MSMLQRFSLSSIAQSIKNTTNAVSEYNKEDIEMAISEIKLLGKRAVEQQRNASNSNQTSVIVSQDIKTILKLMKQFAGNLYVQRVSCHALSNLAMQVVIARYIVSNNGFNYIRNALEKFMNDHKLCWLASSAIWNMARPPANREIIGKNGVKLMLKILSIHHTKHEKVTNTAIGALSNLSLCESIKVLICKKQNISLILDVLDKYSAPQQKSMSVMTSGAGLLANLAVSDDHAETLLQYDALPVLLNLLQWASKPREEEGNTGAEDASDNNSIETTLHRNSCAALNNMVTAKDFINKVLECNGIETIYSFMKQTNNSLFISLLENCLTTLECDVEHPVTTMHLCGLHNRKDLLKSMIQQSSSEDNIMGTESEDSQDRTPSVGSHLWGNKQCESFTVHELLEKKDGNNMTVLQYAALGNHYDLVEFLVKCGANSKVLQNFEKTDESSDDDDIKMHQSQVNTSIHEAKSAIESIKNQHKDALCEVLDEFPTDLCHCISTYENPIDMLMVAKQFN